MSVLVVDANVVVKWVISENDSDAALKIRAGARFIAPDLLIAELGNILHKKVVRNQVRPDDVEILATLLARVDVDLRPMRGLLPAAARLAVRIGHPAYDCFYLALALSEGCPFVTADERLLRKLEEGKHLDLRRACISLTEAVTSLSSRR